MSTKKKDSGIDFGKLKEACKVFNERAYKDVKGNIINIKYVAKPVLVIIENFMTCCELLPGPVQDALPDDDILTVMFQEIEEEQKRVLAEQEGKKAETIVVESTDVGKVEDVIEENPVEEKKPEVVEEEKVENPIPDKVEPEKEPVKPGRKSIEKKVEVVGKLEDILTYVPKGSPQKFVETVMNNDGITMAEIRKQDWNPTGKSFYDPLKKLVGIGLMSIDSQKKIRVVKKDD